MDITLSSVEDAKELLRSWRVDNVRRSEDVVEVWEVLLRDSGIKGEDHLVILEQVAIAAMDLHRVDLVKDTIKELSKHTQQKSIRVRSLVAMQAAMCEDYEKAEEILNEILDEDQSHLEIYKRKIAVLQARGGGDARFAVIGDLIRYLKDNMSDTEAWMELMDLYIYEQEFSKASFCCEELLLFNSSNHLYFQRYAEIRYTQGGFENLKMAKAYYCHAIKLNENNMRALYGLVQTITNLMNSGKCPLQRKKDYSKTLNWATKQIKKRYDELLGSNSDSYCLLDCLVGPHSKEDAQF